MHSGGYKLFRSKASCLIGLLHHQGFTTSGGKAPQNSVLLYYLNELFFIILHIAW